MCSNVLFLFPSHFIIFILKFLWPAPFPRNNNRCVHADVCVENGLAPYLPAKTGGECRKEFSCVDGLVQDTGEPCKCPNAISRNCKSCGIFVEGGPQCTKCDESSARPFLLNGECVKKCPKTQPKLAFINICSCLALPEGCP